MYPEASRPSDRGLHVSWTSGTLGVDLNADPVRDAAKRKVCSAITHIFKVQARKDVWGSTSGKLLYITLQNSHPFRLAGQLSATRHIMTCYMPAAQRFVHFCPSAVEAGHAQIPHRYVSAGPCCALADAHPLLLVCFGMRGCVYSSTFVTSHSTPDSRVAELPIALLE